MPDLVNPRQIAGQYAEEFRGPGRKAKTQGRPEQCEDEHLGQELRDHVGTRRSKRDAHRDLMFPLGGTRQEQRRNVGARDQQQQRDGTKQKP